MTTKIEIFLHNHDERAIIGYALDLIEQKRAAMLTQEITPNGPLAPVIPEIVPGLAEAEPNEPELAHIEGETPDEQPADVEAEMGRFLKEHGVAAARAVLDRFGVKRVRELPPELREALRAALVAQ